MIGVGGPWQTPDLTEAEAPGPFPAPDCPPRSDWPSPHGTAEPSPRTSAQPQPHAHMRPAYAEPVWDAGLPTDAIWAAEEQLGN